MSGNTQNIPTILNNWLKSATESTETEYVDSLAAHSEKVVYQVNLKSFNYGGLTLLEAIQKGMQYSLFQALQPLLPLTEIEWADVLDLSIKTLQRYKKESLTAMLKPIQTEKVVHIAQVTDLGISVFGNKQTFEKWLNTTNFALGSVVPKSLLKSSYGKDLLLAELTRIDHGVFA